MNIFQSIILGVVEGVTEFLPISSTGHMILVGKLLSIPQSEFVKSFEIIIQLGAICAVILVYWKRIIQDRYLWPILLCACIPTMLIGFLLYSFVKHVLLGNPYIVVGALFIGGVLFLALEYYWKKKDFPITSLSQITIPKAIGIGVLQSFSMIPGVSRSAASILGGMSMGLQRKIAVEFSFLLSIPTMIAATGYDLLKTHTMFSGNEIWMLSIGFFVAFITAYIALQSFLTFIQTHTFKVFGFYRIFIAVAYWLVVLR